jgi:hypothetical protein
MKPAQQYLTRLAINLFWMLAALFFGLVAA